MVWAALLVGQSTCYRQSSRADETLLSRRSRAEETLLSRHSRAYKEFLPPVVRPQQEQVEIRFKQVSFSDGLHIWETQPGHIYDSQVVVQARQPISLSCEGHRPVSWHTPPHQEKGPRLKISHSKNNRNKNKFISTISISTTVYKDTGTSCVWL